MITGKQLVDTGQSQGRPRQSEQVGQCQVIGRAAENHRSDAGAGRAGGAAVIPWPWLVVAFGVGSLFGVFLIAMLVAARHD